MSVEILGLGLFTATIGLWIGGMALAGLADLKTALRLIFVTGVVNTLLTAWLFVTGDYLSATIIGVAGVYNFLQAGLGGFFGDHDTKTVGQVLSYIGIFAIVLGYYLTTLDLLYTGIFTILAGIILQAYLVACYGKAQKTCGGVIVALSVINTIISYGLATGLIV